MNILVTALGSIAAPFVVDSLHAMGHFVVGVDVHPRPWIAAAAEVDFFSQVPNLSIPDRYRQALTALCETQGVQLVLPLTDLEVDELCEFTDLFASRGITLAIPGADAVRKFRDKYALYQCARASGLSVIPTYRVANYMSLCGRFPCIVKPSRGRSSEGQLVFQRAEDFEYAAPAGESCVVQPYLIGDVVVADILRSGQGVTYIVGRRELLRTRNGAGVTVQIVDKGTAATLQSHIELLCKAIDFEGCINVEFLQLECGNLALMDANPRFSAGVSFSALAGYNFVRNHVKHFLGEALSPSVG